MWLDRGAPHAAPGRHRPSRRRPTEVARHPRDRATSARMPGHAVGRRLGHAGRRAADPRRHHGRPEAARTGCSRSTSGRSPSPRRPASTARELEWALNDRGLTLPHYPASANCATLGGYLAPRGSGTISTKYGKAEDLVMSIEVVLPRRHDHPHARACRITRPARTSCGCSSARKARSASSRKRRCGSRGCRRRGCSARCCSRTWRPASKRAAG